MEWSPNYRFPAPRRVSVSPIAMPSSRRASLALRSSTNHRRPSYVHALSSAPPDHYDLMEPVEHWMHRRKSQSLATVAHVLPSEPGSSSTRNVGVGVGVSGATRRVSHRASLEWQMYVNVPDDDEVEPEVDELDEEEEDVGSRNNVGGLDLSWPHVHHDAVEKRAKAFSAGLHASTTTPTGSGEQASWTRDDVVNGRERWFASGSIPTVTLLADIPLTPFPSAVDDDQPMRFPSIPNLTGLPRPPRLLP